MEHSQELAQAIRARIAELEADLEAHRRALAVLEEPQQQSKSNGAARTRVKAAPTSTPKRERRPVVSAEAVFDALKEGNDQAAQIAREFGVSAAVVRERLSQLEQAGRVSRTGERRATRWRSHAG
jgi:predicted Rossmann fold nucleotide-binding protein DprA/Smf involved in DNA uptake